MSIKLKVKHLPETDEWTVQWFEDDTYNEDKTYYTNSREDAIMTARAMAEEAYQLGYKDVEVFS